VFAEAPFGVTTVTFTVPASVGAAALMNVGETTEKLEDSFGPKYTAVAPSNPLPTMVTVAPPPADTVDGEIELTTGAPLATLVASASTATRGSRGLGPSAT
jgi:hypothetical protein